MHAIMAMFKYLVELPPHLQRHALTVFIIFTAGTAMLTMNYIQKEKDVQHYVFIGKIIIADFVLMGIRNVIAYAVALISTNVNILKCNIQTIRNFFPVACTQMIMVSGVEVKMMVIEFEEGMVKLIPAMSIFLFVYIQSLLSVGLGLCERFKSKGWNNEYDMLNVDHYDLNAVLPTIGTGTVVIVCYMPHLLRAYDAIMLDGEPSMMHEFVKFLKAMKLLQQIHPIAFTMLFMGGYNIAASFAVAVIKPVEGQVGKVVHDSITSFATFGVVNLSLVVNVVLAINCICTLYKCKRD